MIRGRHAFLGGAVAVGAAAILVVPDPRAVAVGFLIVTALESAFFVVAFGLRSRWWSTTVGRTMFAKAVAFLALVAWIVFSWFAKGFPYRDFIRQFLYLAFAVMWLQMCITLWRFQQAARRSGRSLDDKVPGD